jgi:hypothetical protein
VSGFTTNLLTGIAEHLYAAGVGVWSPSTPPAADDVLIVHTAFPSVPDQVVCLTAYPVSVAAGLTDAVVGVQVRCRGSRNPRASLDLDDAVTDALNGLRRATLGTAPDDVVVSQIHWQSSTPLGPDSNGRYERSTNFYVQVNRPGTYAED